MCLGRNGQVGAAPGGAEIGARRTPASAVGGRRLVITHALLSGAVEIGVRRNAGLDRRLHHRVAECAAHRVGDMQRTADALREPLEPRCMQSTMWRQSQRPP